MVTTEIDTRLLINGELVEASDRKTFPLYNPATKEKTVEVPEASEDDTNAAVAAAKAAFPSWSALTPAQRGKYFKILANLLRGAHKDLAYLEAISMGRPITQYPDAMAAAAEFDYYSEAALSTQGTTSLTTPGFVNMSFRQPYGVAAAIIPWNMPLLFLARKAAPALAAGCTVVIKSSEKAPLTSAKVAKLVVEAGFPPGVINIISGHGKLSGAILAAHMDVRVLSFTGSCNTGRLIQVAAAKSNFKHVILEMGGKSPAIIFDDANLEKAAAETQNSIQWNSGQVCMANSRIYVHEAVADRFVELFKQRYASIVPGDPTDPKTTQGPQADEAQYQSVLSYIEAGKGDGSLLRGGNGDNSLGFFVEPAVFTNVSEHVKIMKEEIFGPVVIINTFKNEQEVLQKANDTEFGLYASVYTKDLDRAMRFAKGIESGYIGINCASPTNAHDMPFGGYKQSGVGREGYLASMNNFMETKTVLVKYEVP